LAPACHLGLRIRPRPDIKCFNAILLDIRNADV
jgi:hypothetical protein